LSECWRGSLAPFRGGFPREDRHSVQAPRGAMVVGTPTSRPRTASGSLASPGFSSPDQGLVRHRSLFPLHSGLWRLFPSTLPRILAWLPRRLFRFSKDRPSIGLVAARPLPLLVAGLPRLLSLRLAFAKGLARSAFVVSLHLDGFLRAASCGFVAPRSRSWGSSRSLVPVPFSFRFPFLSPRPRRSTLRSSSSFVVVPRVSTVLRDSSPPAVHRSSRLDFRVSRHLTGLPRPLLLAEIRFSSTSLGFFFISSWTSSTLRVPGGSASRRFLSRGPRSLSLRCRCFRGSVRFFQFGPLARVPTPPCRISALPSLGIPPREDARSRLQPFCTFALFRFRATFLVMLHLGGLFPRVVFLSASRGLRHTFRFIEPRLFEGRGFVTGRFLFADKRRLHHEKTCPREFVFSVFNLPRYRTSPFPWFRFGSGYSPRLAGLKLSFVHGPDFVQSPSK
jgi:hypothetical protein